ncbi:MAG TPA: hypothetical protein VMF58_17560 [Rhizomicrobium sp.]|nr:hypothetical protein [Rhizomicrobium sp.]
MDDLYAFWLIIRNGIYHIQPIQFAVIAVLAGIVLPRIVFIVPAAIGASLVYVLVNAILPTLGGAEFVRPHLNHAFWYFFMSGAIAFTVAIGVVYLLKSLVTGLRN